MSGQHFESSFMAAAQQAAEAASQPQVDVGIVGWDDTDEHFDKGDPDHADVSYRHTLVRVTLWRGSNRATINNGGTPQGYKVLARMASSMNGIPAKGTQVYVVVPHGFHIQNGAYVIIAALEEDQRHNLTAGQKVIPAGAGAAKVIVNNDGSLSLFTTDDNTDNGKSVYIRVAKDGFQFVAPWGTLKFDASGLHVLHSSGASFDLGGIYGLPSPLDQLASYVKMSAAMVEGECSAASFGSGTADALAASTAVMATLTQLQTQITTFNTALTGFLSANPGPVSGSALGAALAAVSTAMSTSQAAVAEATNPATSNIPTSTSSS